MQFDSFNDFLAMGGYGFYVWLSFGISAVLIIALIFSSIMGHKQVLKNIAIRQERDNKLRQLRKQRSKRSDNKHNEIEEVNL
ncbi:heme exporter protein CcmD [Colwellia sp. MSW7]|uniref:Heme exporter protein D n=1 Tax=Colwellia maritima TaxID=2912588 RepID=A0ABS9X3Q5_9GAMM|nr:heme exporter protein CcmD [Colwellia maritima]MCI2284700.1 heme exporter protein CcmD [Colwellia maritima]